MAWASTWGARPSWWLVDTQLQRGGRWLLSWFEVYCSWELSACGSPVIHRGKSKRQMVTTPADFRIALDLWHGRGGRGACFFFVPSTSMCFLHFHWSQSWKKQPGVRLGVGSMEKTGYCTFWIIQGSSCDLRYSAGRESGWILVMKWQVFSRIGSNFQIKQQGMTDTFTLWFHLDWMVTFWDMNSGVNAVWKWLTS